MLHPEVSLFVELKSTGQDSRLPQVIPGERLIMLEQMFDTGSRANVRRCYTILMFLDAHYSVPLLFHRVLGELGLLQQKPLYVKLISVLRREAFGTSENLAIAHILFQIVKPVLSSIYMTARTDKNDKFSDDEDMDESPPRIEEVKEEPLSEDEEPFIEDPEDEEDPAGHDAMFPVLRPILPLHLPGFGAPQPQFYAPGKQQPQFYAPPLVPKQEPGVQVSPRRKGVPPRGYQTSIWQCQLCRKFVKGDGNRRAHVITMHTTMPCTCPRTGCDMQLSNTYAIGHHLKRAHDITKSGLTDEEQVAMMQLNTEAIHQTDGLLRQCFPPYALVGVEEMIRLKSEDRESRICRVCDVPVLSAQGRRNHILSVHEPTLLKCFRSGCDYSANGWNALRSHLKRNHMFCYRSMTPEDAKNYIQLRKQMASLSMHVEKYFPQLSDQQIAEQDQALNASFNV